MITLKAPAKINLYLEILNKRADGYYNLCSLFQMLGLYDLLSIKEASEGLHLTIEGPSEGTSLSADPSNLVLRAASLLREEMQMTGLPIKGAHMHLVKKIPIAAGLGGGSSDAAATLVGLNRLWSLGWSREKLAELGSRIGSDLPFFFYGPTAWVSGRGEIVEPISLCMEKIIDGGFLLLHPDFAVSTAEVFRKYAQAHALGVEDSEIELTRALSLPNIPLDMKTRPSIDEILQHPRNDLEKVTLTAHPELKAMKTSLSALGGKGVLMSGSGPSLSARFKDSKTASVAAAHFKEEGHRVSVVPILKQSPFKEFL